MLLATALTLTGCTAARTPAPTPSQTQIGTGGGSVTMPQDRRVEVSVPAGTVSTALEVAVAPLPNAPAPPAGTTLLGSAVQVSVSAEVAGAHLMLPVDTGALGAAGTRDFYIATYNAALAMWVPLATDYDPATHRAQVTAPHFSTFAVFGYDIPSTQQLTGGIRWAGAQIGDVVHDAAGGIKSFAGQMRKSLTGLFKGGELRQPACEEPERTWEVSADAKEVRGCVVAEGEESQLRVGNTYQLPFVIAPAPGSDLKLSEADSELSLTEAIARVANAKIGRGYLPRRGTTSLTLPPGEVELGHGYEMPVYVDGLGMALQVIIGLLSVMPGEKVLTEQVDRDVLQVLWNNRDQTWSVIVARVRQTRQFNVGKPGQVEALEAFLQAAECTQRLTQGAANANRNRDGATVAKSTVEVALDCTGEILQKSESAFKQVWEVLKGTLEVAKALQEVKDAISVGVNHFGGQVSLQSRRINPDLRLGRAYNLHTQGLGTVRPAGIFLGGMSSDGYIGGMHWSGWGGRTATGTAEAKWIGEGQVSADAPYERGVVIASDPGDCHGRQAYRKLVFYFPQHDQSATDYPPLDICEGI